MATDAPSGDWGKIGGKIALEDGTRILFWTVGMAWVEFPDGSTTQVTNAVREPKWEEWDRFVEEATRWVRAECERRAVRAGGSGAGSSRPVFGVTEPPPGALGKRSGRPASYAKRRGK